MPGDEPVFGVASPEPVSARAVVNEMVEAGLLDEVMDRVDSGGLALTGAGGFLPEMIKAVLERALQSELTGHLGYEKGDPAGRGSPNSRNGTTPKTLGTELSHESISKITDAVLEEVREWQGRPLEEIYPIVYLDALVVKVREGHQVRNKAAHIAVGVDLDGVKHVLGIWVQASEGAKFWAGVCAELRNRGVRDVLIVCCDGLTGFPEAIEATWPQATVQTCTVHLIRAAMRFVSYQDRKKVAAALRPIYTAPTADVAESELLAFAESPLGKKYPATVATWENAWERFIPFLAFPPEVRKVIYTTNAIESLNYQLRKIIKNRGHFPNDDAVIKLLWLAIRDIEDKRARQRAKEKGAPRGERKAPGRLVEGAVIQGWKAALGALAVAYPDRLASYVN
jgi:putative transposase